MNPAANNSVIGTQLLQTLGFPACNRANNADEPARATHLLDESIILFNTYPLKIISSSNAAKNNIMLTMNIPGLKPTYPVIVIAPNNHKIKNKPQEAVDKTPTELMEPDNSLLCPMAILVALGYPVQHA